MASRLTDAQLCDPLRDPQATFHTRAPVLRLDHIFVSGAVDVLAAAPVRTPLARIASDHFPLMAELRAVGDAAAARRPRAAVAAGGP